MFCSLLEYWLFPRRGRRFRDIMRSMDQFNTETADKLLSQAGYRFTNVTHEHFDGYTVTIVDPYEPDNDGEDMVTIVAAIVSSHHVDPRTGYTLMLQVEKRFPTSVYGLPTFFVWGYGPVPSDITKDSLVKMTTFYEDHYMFESAVQAAVNSMKTINEILPFLDMNTPEETIQAYALANPITRSIAHFHANCSEETRIMLALYGWNRDLYDFPRRPWKYYEAVCLYLDINVNEPPYKMIDPANITIL